MGALAIAGLVRWQTAPAAAQSTLVDIGGECSDAAQCRQVADGDPVLCAENGTGDGITRCCMTGLYGCDTDADCCGAERCRHIGEYYGSYCTSEPFGTVNPGEPCTSSDQCWVGAYGGPATCADNGMSPDGSLACCREVGYPCGGDAGCCGAALCITVVCTVASAGSMRTVLEDANLRSAPAMSSPILMVISAGSSVTELVGPESQNGYVPVRYQGVSGWVAGALLGLMRFDG